MATNSTSGGGTAQSFSNTPQAGDDSYLWNENTFQSSTSWNALTKIMTLNVMSNDLGGNAKQLWSIQDVNGNSLDNGYAVMKNGEVVTGTSAWELTDQGNYIRINNDKIEYRVTGDINALGAGESLHDVFNYTIRLANGTLSEARVTIHVDGVNDLASITVNGTPDTTVVEAGGVANGTAGDPNASGDLNITDPDAGQAKFQIPASTAGTYGNFVFDANTGTWSYTLDNNKPATQALNVANVVHDTLTVTSLDGTASYVIDITINGANDAAVITGTATGAVTEASGVLNGTPGTSPATGDLDATDVDSSAAFVVQSGAAKTYGTFSIDATGAWSYTLNESNAAVQALNTGDSLHEFVTVATADGTTQVIDITINGANDAAVITGTATGAVTEASGVLNGTPGTSPATGDLDATDVDSSAAFVVQSGAAKTYGTFSIDATGAWSYTLNESNAAVQALNTGDSLHEFVTVATADGTTQVIDITINGANDAAVITGTATGAVTEASGVLNGTPGTSPATGDLDATDVDSSAAFVVQSGAAKTYGTFSIDATGAWSYTLNESNAAVQALNTGDSLHEFVTVATADGTTQVIDITINGANDAAVITGTATGAVTEASGVLNGTPGTSPATGDLDATDVDSSAAFVVQSGAAKTYGTFSIDATGAWSYTLNESNAAVQALNTGDSLHEFVTVATADGTTQVIDITINGANDAAVITGTATGAVTEASGVLNGTPGTSPATGDLDATDVDSSAAFVVQSGAAKTYGTFSIDATGAWSYTLNESNAAVQALNTGDSLHEFVTVATADGTTQVIDITINGANDAAVITGTATGAVTEASGVLNGTPGTSPATGDLNATDVDSSAAFVVQSGAAKTYGTFSIDATGAWSYTLNESNAAVQALNTGDSLHEFVTVATADGTTQVIDITINGANDAAVITGTATGAVTEASGVLNGTPGTSPATGDLDATDVDSSAAFVVQSGAAKTYGTFSIDATGAWSYTLNESNAAVQALNTGDSLHEFVTVATADGTTQVIDITINGANDAAVITGTATGAVTEASGVLNGTPGTSPATGDLDATDVDSSAAFVVQSGAAKTYGTFSIDATGAWSYTLNESNAAVQALNTGDSLHEFVTVATADGTTQVIDITINGANDAAVITGTATGAVTEASGVLNGTPGTSPATGDLDATDVDSSAAFVVQSGAAKTYGTFSIDATGAWSYTLNESNAAVQALNTGDSLHEFVTVATADGTTQVIDITINGANDAAVITGTATGAVTEASGVLNGTPGTSPATGDLDATDVDSSAAFVVQSGAAKTYGTFSIDATGAWSYTLNESNAAVQALNTGDSLHEFVTVATADGTTQVIDITINGANDAAVITGTATGAVTEASGVLNGTPGTSPATGDLNATDVDSSAAFVVQSGAAKTYGTFSIDATGAWSYTLNESNAAVQALNTGDSLHEFVTVATADGTTQVIDITINGANDAAVITGTATGAVTEASGVLNGTPGTSPATGDLDATDVDSSAAFVVQSGAAKTYGTFSIDATGAWSYTLNESNAAVQALNTGDSLHEFVTVATADGTTQVIDITINGANDAAVITGTATGAVTEASGVLNGTPGTSPATGDLDATDVDSSAAFVVQSGAAKTYGTFSIDATGAWSYTLNESNAAVQALNTGDSLHEFVTVATADGTTQVIDITINGANDAAVITGTATGAVTEASGVLNGTPGTSPATGDLDATDVDSSAAFVVQSGAAKTYGTFSIDATGAWSYTLNESNAAVQALNTGDSLHEFVTVATADGTTQVIDITINGANDAAVITGTATGAVTEASGVLNGTPGTSPATGDLDATDVDSSAAFVVQSGAAKTYGTFSIDATGAWSYTLNESNAAVQALNTGDSLHEFVTVATADGTTQVIDITINGANDAAVITGTATGAVTEASGVLNGTPGTSPATGDLDATDVDSSAAFVVQSGAAKTYGTFSIDATGAWSYTLNESNAAVQALNTGDSLHEFVTVATADGTTQVIDITINGANDAAVITGTATGAVTEASGVLNGTPGTSPATGDLDATDVDSSAAFVVQSGAAKTYGTFSIDATGAWSYTLNESNAAVQALNTGDSLHEFVTVATADGTTQVIDITINGANDAAVITGTATGAVTEASGVLNGTPGTSPATGDLDATDVDSSAAFVVQSGAAKTYGTFSIDATGAWSYTLNESNAAVQALNTGDSLHEFVTVATADGTTQVIDITINGANDAAVITGTATGAVTEASGVLNGTPGTSPATGDLDATDVDSSAAFVVQSGAAKTYGTFSIDATGAWSYTLNESNAAVQALNTGDSLHEFVTVATADGTTQVIDITINGANDAAVITGTATGAVTEASGVLNGTPGTSPATGDLDATDVDSSAAFVVQSGAAKTYGTFSIDATGAWSYTLNESNAAVQALNTGDSLHEFVTVATADGTTQVIDITINGANDAAVITGTATGAVTEASGVLNGTPGTSPATGDLDATDVDSSAAFVVQSGAAKTYGTFSIDATGAWSYTLNESNAAVQALNTGDSLHEFVTVATADGTTQVIDITINGANDAAVITGTATGAVTEASGVLNGTPGTSPATGDLDATDVDSSAAFVVQSGAAKTYGTFSIDATGAWSYTLNESNAAVQALNTGDSLHEFVTVATADGTTQVIDITINGANDAAVITGTATGAVTEASGVLNGTPGTSPATGDLDATDVDSSAAFVVQSGAAKTYGTFSIDATGAWSYTLNESNAAVQALNTGDSLHEFVTVATADGTTQVIDITINGANDAAVITGTATGAVTEASGVLNGTPGTSPATGDLDATDVDSSAAFVVQSGAAKTYGTFSIDATGAWSYTLNESNAAVQALNTGDSLHEFVTVATADGTTQVIDITINGANDAAVITGTATGAVTEDASVVAGNLVAGGTLVVNDVDAGQSSFQAVAPANLIGNYGNFTFDAGTGNWTYKADDTRAAIQQLRTGDSLTDTLTVQSADGTTQAVTVTINGTNDTPVIMAPTLLHYWQSGVGDTTAFNEIRFADVEGGTATVTLTRTAGDGTLSATNAGGVSVGGSATALTLTGLVADINKFLSENRVTLDSQGNDDDTYTISINDGGPGGTASVTGFTISDVAPDFANAGGQDSNNTLAGTNVYNATANGGNGMDVLVTAWNHSDGTGTATAYVGGNQVDSITAVFTPTQLDEVLSDSTLRAQMTSFFDGSPTAAGTDLNLDASSWNATIDDFETVSLGVANVNANADNYVSLATWLNLPAFLAGQTGNGSANLLVGTAGGQTISGGGGNDVLAAFNTTTGSTLNGEAGSDLVVGSAGADVISGGTGQDILMGGLGADTFKWVGNATTEAPGAANADVVIDYSYNEGDKLDLSALLTSFAAGDDVSQYVQLGVDPSNHNIVVQVDVDGAGAGAVMATVYTLNGIGNTDSGTGESPVKVTFGGYDHVLTNTVTLDTTAPTVTITDDEPGTANIAGGNVVYTFQFSEAVTGFDTTDVVVANGTKGTFTAVDADTYTLVVTPTAAFEGNLTVDVGAGAAIDAVSNPSTAATQAVQAVDTKTPTLVITDDEPGTANIPGGNVVYTFQFSEDVTGFDATDVTVANGTKGTFTAVDADTYTLAVTPTASFEGNLTVDVGGAAAADTAGNPSAAATQSVQAVDTKAPTVVSVLMSDTALKIGDTSAVTITFSEAVTNFNNSDVTVQNGTLTTLTTGDGGVTWAGTFTPTGAIEDATNVVTVATTYTDVAGNTGGTGSSANYTIDTNAPTVTITDDEPGTANIAGGNVVYTFQFSEPVTGFVAGDVTVVNGTKGTFTAVDADTYTLVVTPTAGFEGNLTVDVAAAAAIDAATNPSIAATQSVQAVDTKAPTIVITDDEAAATANIAGGNVVFTFQFSEAVTGFVTTDVVVTGGTKGTFTAVDADTYTLVVTPNTNTQSGTITVNVAGSVAADTVGNGNVAATQATQAYDTLAPTVIVTSNPASVANGNSSTITYQFSETVAGFTSADTTATRGNLTNNLTAVDGDTYTQTYNRTSNGSNANVSVTANSYTDVAGNNGAGGTSADLPAGVAGSPINLALPDPSSDANDLVTVTIAGVPSNWTLNAGTNNGDGTWTVQTNDPSSLTVTTAPDFTGAMVLPVTMSWTNSDGATESVVVYDNVEAYAPGAPIFAASVDDNLTGSSGDDTFVFAQPIGNNVIHSFDAAADKIDLIGFAGVNGFADLSIANDANGNAVITVAAGSTITVQGVDAAALAASNFEFDVDPVTVNAGTMTIYDGAMLPLGGTVDNSGTIAMQSSGSETDLEILFRGANLTGGGHVTMSDSDQNVIFGGSADTVLVNVDNIISGAGQLGAGQLTFVNESSVIADGTYALVVDTGANAVSNSGLMEATGSGGLLVMSDILNDGTLWANGGNVTVLGAVSGTGHAEISGSATMEFGGASTNDTAFDAGAAGTLVLDDSDHYSGAVSGFDGNDSLHLSDVFADGATLSYTANAEDTGGVLTASDGVTSAQVTLVGQYVQAGFTLTSLAGVTGSVITYDPNHT